MIARSTIDKVRELDIVSIISTYIELKRNGANYLALSPFGQEKTPSFTVFTRNNNFKDFSSGKQGDGIAFVMEHLKMDFYEAIREIARNHGIDIEEEDLTPEEKAKRQAAYEEKKEIHQVLEYAKTHFEGNKIPATWRQQRKFNSLIIEKFAAGYGNGKTSLVEMATKAGFSNDLLKKAGLIRHVLDPASTETKVWNIVDAYTDRVVFPIRDTQSKCLAFTARYIGQDEKSPKYLNSPDTAWEKGKHLYGLYEGQRLIRQVDKAYLVEGPTDVWRMHEKGLENTISPCGSALTDAQCKLLFRHSNRVTILPDNDKAKPENAGLKAMGRNAMLLLKHGFFVNVLIPGFDSKTRKNSDPDSYLRNMRTEKQFSVWMGREEGYIEDYLCRVCMTMAEGNAEEKAAAVKKMADALESVKETLYRNALYDNVAKMWPYFKKEYKLQKREVNSIGTTDVENLKREARDEYFKNKFLVEDDKYVTWIKGGEKKDLSNFTFKVVFTVSFINEGEIGRKAVLNMTDVFGHRSLAVVSTDDFCASQTFKKVLRRRGEFMWKGTDEHLDNIYEKEFLKAAKAVELDRMGWNNKYGFWVWSNGVYYDNEFHPMDKYGLIQRTIRIKCIDQFLMFRDGSQLIIEGKLDVINSPKEYLETKGENELQRMIDEKRIAKVDFFFLPFGTSLSIDTGDDDKGLDFKKDIRLVMPEKDQEWTFDAWGAKIAELYGTNGWIMIAYYMASIFRDIIFKANHGWFPLLYFFGKPKSGKSTAARSVYLMFGEPPQKDGINLSSGSTGVAMGRYMDSLSNVPGLFNEFKNHIPDRIKEVMKGWADGSGRVQGTRSAKGTTAVIPRSGALICGQELPTSEAALFSRMIPLEFDEKNRPPKTVFDAFKNIEETGIFSWITCRLLDHRDIFTHYKTVEASTYESLLKRCLEACMKPDDRLLLNACTLLTTVRLFMDHTDLAFPFNYEALESHILTVMEMSSTIQAEADEAEKFFTILMSMVGVPNGIKEGEAFMLKNIGEKILLYLKYNACYGPYAARARQEGATPMDKTGLGRYLKKHPSYVEETRSARIGNTKKTSAWIFDYSMLLEKDISWEVARHMSEEDNTARERNKSTEFQNLICNLEAEKLYTTRDLIEMLSKKLDDHIAHAEFVSMCLDFNQAKKFGIQVQKNDEKARDIYIEKLNGAQSEVPF